MSIYDLMDRMGGGRDIITPNPSSDDEQQGFLSSLGNSIVGGFGSALSGVGRLAEQSAIENEDDNRKLYEEAGMTYDPQYSPLRFLGDVMHDSGQYLADNFKVNNKVSMQDVGLLNYLASPGGAVSDAGSLIGSAIPLATAAIATKNPFILAGLGAAWDSASEAGNTYDEAIARGLSPEEASRAMHQDLRDNIGLSIAQNALTVGMAGRAIKGVGSVLGKVGTEAAEDVAESAGKGLLGSLAEAGGKVASFGEGNFAGRLAKGLGGSTAEAYTEGLQQEFQDSAIEDRDINFAPTAFSKEGVDQGIGAFVGTLPMALLGSIGGRRGHRGTTNVEEAINNAPETAEAAPEINAVEATPNAIPNVKPEPNLIEDEVNLDDGVTINTPLDNPDGTEAVQASPQESTSNYIHNTAPLDGDFNSNINTRVDNPSEMDIAERKHYSDVDNFPQRQGLANEILSNAKDVLGYDPMESESKMTKDQTKDLAKAIVQNDDIPINSERVAYDVAKTIANRVDDNIKRKQATDIYNKAQEIGYELSDEDTKHLTDAFPDRNYVRDISKSVNEFAKNTEKENKQKISDQIDSVTKDIEDRGINSQYYDATGDNEDVAKALKDKGLDISNPEVAKAIQKATTKIKRKIASDNKNFVKTAKESIEKDKENSPYYMKGETLDTMNNQEIAKGVKETLDPSSIRKIHNYSRFHDNSSKTPMGRDLKIVREFNRKNGVGVHLDEAKVRSIIDPQKRSEFIKTAVDESEKRKKIAKSDNDKYGITTSRRVMVENYAQDKIFAENIAKHIDDKKLSAKVKANVREMLKGLEGYKPSNLDKIVEQFPEGIRDKVKNGIVKYANKRLDTFADAKTHVEDIERSINSPEEPVKKTDNTTKRKAEPVIKEKAEKDNLSKNDRLYKGDEKFLSYEHDTEDGKPRITIGEGGGLQSNRIKVKIRKLEGINKESSQSEIADRVDDYLFDNGLDKYTVDDMRTNPVKVNDDGTVSANLRLAFYEDDPNKDNFILGKDSKEKDEGEQEIKTLHLSKELLPYLDKSVINYVKKNNIQIKTEGGKVVNGELEKNGQGKGISDSARASVEAKPKKETKPETRTEQKKPDNVASNGTKESSAVEKEKPNDKQKQTVDMGNTDTKVSGKPKAKADDGGRGKRVSKDDGAIRQRNSADVVPTVGKKKLKGYESLYSIPITGNKEFASKETYVKQFSGFTDKAAKKVGDFFNELGTSIKQGEQKEEGKVASVNARTGAITLFENPDSINYAVNHEMVHQALGIVNGNFKSLLSDGELKSTFTTPQKGKFLDILTKNNEVAITKEFLNNMPEEEKSIVNDAMKELMTVGEDKSSLGDGMKYLLYADGEHAQNARITFANMMDIAMQNKQASIINNFFDNQTLVHELAANILHNNMVNNQLKWAKVMKENGLLKDDSIMEQGITPNEMEARIKDSGMPDTKKLQVIRDMYADYDKSSSILTDLVDWAKRSKDYSFVKDKWEFIKNTKAIYDDEGRSILDHDFLMKQIKEVNPETPDTTARNHIFDMGQEYLNELQSNKNKLTVLGKMLRDPMTIFEKYIPSAKKIYDLANEAQLTRTRKLKEFGENFVKVWEDLKKNQTKALEDAILYANDVHQDPIEMFKFSPDLFGALKHDSYREHFDDFYDAQAKQHEIKEQFEHTKIIGNDNTGYDVLGLSDGSKLFKTEESAQKYVNDHMGEALKEVFDITGHNDLSEADKNLLIDRYKKHREAMNKAFEQMVETKLKVEGKNALVPTKKSGYLPHIHLPYTVYEKTQNGKWEKTVSFRTQSEARAYTKKLAKEGKQAIYYELSRFSQMVNFEGSARGDILSLQQLKELEETGVLSEMLDSSKYSTALFNMIAPVFEGGRATGQSILKRISKIEKARAFGDTEEANALRVAQRQIKLTKIKRLLANKKTEMLTESEFNELLSRATGRSKFNPHFLSQTDAKGYSRNVRNVTMRYFGDAANYIAKAKLKYDGTRVYAETFGKDFAEPAVTQEEKFVKNYLSANLNKQSITDFDNFMNEVVSSIPKLGPMIKRYYSDHPYTDALGQSIAFNNVMKLGLGNVSSLVVQLSQLLNANAKLAKGVNLVSGNMVKAARILNSGEAKKYNDLFHYLGIGEENFALDRELTGDPLGYMNKKLIGKESVSSLANKSMYFFEKGDTIARKISAIAAYEESAKEWNKLSAQQKEFNKEKQWRYKWVRDFVIKTNFDYGIANTPLGITNLGVTGKALLQFKKFPLFTLNFMLNNTKAENVRFLTSLALVAGLGGMPWEGLLDGASELMTGESISDVVKRDMINWAGGNPTKKAMVNVALYGAFAHATGINLQGRIGLQDVFSIDGGPTYGLIKGAYQSLASQSPRPLINAISSKPRQIEQAIEGEYKTASGKTLDKYSDYDRVLKILGFKPIGENNARDAQQVEVYAKKQYATALKEAKEAYKNHPTPDNFNALRVYGMKPKEIRYLLTSKNKPKKERMGTDDYSNMKNAAREFSSEDDDE